MTLWSGRLRSQSPTGLASIDNTDLVNVFAGPPRRYARKTARRPCQITNYGEDLIGAVDDEQRVTLGAPETFLNSIEVCALCAREVATVDTTVSGPAMEYNYSRMGDIDRGAHRNRVKFN